MVAKVTPATFETQVLKSSQPVVVEVWAPWCGPCRAMAPILEQAACQFTGQARFMKLNADEHPELVRQYKVLGIPTLLYFSHGRLVDRGTGLQSAEAIAKRLTPLLSLSAEAAAE
jgi:thioredoxin 1